MAIDQAPLPFEEMSLSQQTAFNIDAMHATLRTKRIARLHAEHGELQRKCLVDAAVEGVVPVTG